MLSSYSKKKDSIIEIYNNVLKSKILPIDNITEKDIEEQQKKLREDQFILCVAGQIKAGKSTLLNALIFHEEILPADDLPHTAKITEIKYADKASFTAYFYTKQEWEELKLTPLQNDDGELIMGGYFKKYLDEDMELSIQNGIYENEVIGSPPKKINDLMTLKNFVAKDGMYTPFIKSVTIGYPSELLKNIVIVDTPGTNDPNQFRSKMTEEWIHKADAVIYATYAGRALDDTDINFIDKYLIHVPASKRLIVINKIDTIEDKNEVVQWVGSLKNDEKYSKRIFSKDTTFDYVSALGALISNMRNKGLYLDETLEYYEESLDESGYLSAVNHGISKLQGSIEDKLIANKGTSIIEGHKNFIVSLFDRKIDNLLKELNENKNVLNTVLSDQDDLEKKLTNIKITREKVSLYFSEFKEQLSNQQNQFVHSFEADISQVKWEISDNIKEELNRIRNTSHFANEVQWIVKNNIESEMEKFVDLGKRQEKKFQNDLDDSIERLIDELDTYKAFNPNQLRSIVSFASSFESRKIGSSISSQFSGNHINSVVTSSTNFFQRWFDTRGGLENVRSSVMTEVNALLENEFNISMRNNIRDSVKTGSDKLRSNVEKEIKQTLVNMQNEIEEIQDFTGDKQAMSKQYQENIEMLSLGISDFESRKKKIKDVLDAK